jgi:hypothetical protein
MHGINDCEEKWYCSGFRTFLSVLSAERKHMCVYAPNAHISGRATANAVSVLNVIVRIILYAANTRAPTHLLIMPKYVWWVHRNIET